jgi:hypothetical protein
MTHLNLAGALIREVADASPEETVRKLKTAVAEELSQLDPTASIHFTDYFNHTYTPDIVLRWSKVDSGERHVYLRLTDDAGELADGIAVICDRKPVVVTLLPPRVDDARFDVDPEAALDARAAEADTLLTDINALDTVGTARTHTPTAKLLGTALSRGGRGLMTSDRADSTIEVVDAGFGAAQQGEPDAVGKAADVADRLFRPEQAGRINRFLQAIWLGNGGSSDRYPRQLYLGGELDDESWAFLLNLADIDDMGFWRSIGRSLSLAQVSRFPQPSGLNLHHLVRANCQTIWARACRVLTRDQTLFDGQGVGPAWEWMIERSALALKGPRLVAYLGQNKEALDGIDTDESDGVAVGELRKRAIGRRIIKVVGRVGAEELDLVNIEHRDVTRSQVLDLLAKTPGADLQVTRVISLVGSGQGLSLDFTTSSATAVTNSQPALRSLVVGALPLLRAMTVSDVAEMSEAFDVPDGRDLFSLVDEVAIHEASEQDAHAAAATSTEPPRTVDVGLVESED